MPQRTSALAAMGLLTNRFYTEVKGSIPNAAIFGISMRFCVRQVAGFQLPVRAAT